MRKSLFFLGLTLLINTTLWARGPAKDPKPLIALHALSTWNYAMRPTEFVLYDNGLLIQRAPEKKYRYTFLNKDERKQLGEALEIGDGFYHLKDDYSFGIIRDGPTYTISVWNEHAKKAVSIYGLFLDRSFQKDRNTAPTSFLKVYDRIVAYRNPHMKPWIPKRIEVIAWPAHPSARAKPYRWPSRWPNLKTAVKSVNLEYYRISMPYSALSQLIKINACLKENQAILISGKKCFVDYRLPLPNEEAWITEPY